ncbi:hypothetical protein FOPE_10840 [Fonsecaea pedrosoi]|nr:hypothetical protein FOPE_10840 [Fonsecaea pedrosoi]
MSFLPLARRESYKSFPLPFEFATGTSEPARASSVHTQALPQRFVNFVGLVGNRDLRTGHEQVGAGKKETAPHIVIAEHRPRQEDVALAREVKVRYYRGFPQCRWTDTKYAVVSTKSDVLSSLPCGSSGMNMDGRACGGRQ